MVLPPDHADRVIAQHRSRVEKVAMMGTLLLITSAGWWLFPAMDGSVELLPRMGPRNRHVRCGSNADGSNRPWTC